MSLHEVNVTPIFPQGPRERALDEGIGALGDAELLAIVLGTGIVGRPVSVLAAELLDQTGGIPGLTRLGPAAIAQLPGVGNAKALRIAASIELGRRASIRSSRARSPLRTAAETARYVRGLVGAL